jgi:hypothetical protein
VDGLSLRPTSEQLQALAFGRRYPLVDLHHLRRGVWTAGQRAPYFEVDAGRVVSMGVDTGILRRLDADQFHWLRTTLERARKRSRQGRGYGIVGHFRGGFLEGLYAGL